MGLITFNTYVTLREPITPVFRDFRQSLENITASGSTALWDALYRACDELERYGRQYPDALKRIVALTDGENNHTRHKAHEVCMKLQVRYAVVDQDAHGAGSGSHS